MSQVKVVPNENGDGFDVVAVEDDRVLSNHADQESAEAAAESWAEDLEEGSIVDLPGDPGEDEL